MKLVVLKSIVLTSCLIMFSALQADSMLRMATTTSTDNSGLLQYLLPEFEKDAQHKVQVIAVGTGKALKMGTDGDVDIVLVHAPGAEKKFVDSGAGVKRFPVMYNDFVIVGSKTDPAKISDDKNVIEALKKIATTKSMFVSRGDDSGTHKKELKLWQAASIQPGEPWYREAGQGMGKVLLMASELQAYTMTDRGTWLAMKDKLDLKIVSEGDAGLFNPYGIIAVNPDKHSHVNHRAANDLINWITSDKGQKMISEFKVGGEQLFVPKLTD